MKRKNIEEIEKYLLEKRQSIKLNNIDKVEAKSVKEFLVQFFDRYNRSTATILVKNQGVNKNIQCGPGAYRSIGDLYLLCKYYFPKTTLKEVISIIYRDINICIGSSYCNTVHKRVFQRAYSPNNKPTHYGVYHEDEFGNSVDYYLLNI